MSTLSVQASTYATLLSIISKSNKNNHTFAVSVIEKLMHQKLLKSIIDNDVLTSKIVLRSLACILSCHSLTLEGDEGFAALLETLITIAYTSWNDNITTIGGAGVGGSDTLLSELGQAVIYLLATTLPWAIVALLHTQLGASLVDRCIPLFTRIITEYRSLYSTGGKLAIFHMDNLLVDEDTGNYESSHIHLGPSASGSPVCWDNLWEACKSAIDIITLAKADPKIFTLPSCMLCPWVELANMLTITTTTSPLEGGEGVNEVEHSSDMTNETTTTTLTLGSTFITAFHTALTDKQTSTTTPTTTTPTHTSTTIPITWLKPCFSVFDPNSSEGASIICTTLNRIEKQQIIDYYRDIIYFFDPIIRYDGTYIGNITTLCKHLLSLSKILPSHMNTLLFEYILVEVLLVQLSLSTFNSIYHGLICRIVLELCKTATSFPPVLALGMSVIYQLGSDFDSTVWRNYASWLSFHLLNTKLIWPYWVHWAEEYEASVDVTSESKLLLKLVIDKCAHAMVPESVRQALPDELKELVVAERGPYCSLFDPDNADEQGIVYICMYYMCRIYSCIRVYVNLCMYTNTISVMP